MLTTSVLMIRLRNKHMVIPPHPYPSPYPSSSSFLLSLLLCWDCPCACSAQLTDPVGSHLPRVLAAQAVRAWPLPAIPPSLDWRHTHDQSRPPPGRGRIRGPAQELAEQHAGHMPARQRRQRVGLGRRGVLGGSRLKVPMRECLVAGPAPGSC